MKALVLGAGGQLGIALQAAAPRDASVVALRRDQCDLANAGQINGAIADARPDIVINAAAYTAVDRAESEPERAQLINATAVGWLAQATQRAGARFVHVSTDFVFDGESSRAYLPEDPTHPLGVYGRTKREGEIATLRADTSALVVRTAWVHSATGANFVRTILRLIGERDQLRIVADQIGTPTHAGGLAAALWSLAARNARGIYHYTDTGVASWYDFAVAIQEEAAALQLTTRTVPIAPISTAEYRAPAPRPRFSVLNCSQTWEQLGGPAPHWRVNLRRTLTELQARGQRT